MPKIPTQRATKADREAAREVLKELFLNAYAKGEVLLEFTQDQKALHRKTYDQLADYRKYLRNVRAGQYELWSKVNEISIIRTESTIKLVRKDVNKMSGTSVALNLKNMFPEHFSETNVAPAMDSILENFNIHN